MRNQKSVYPNQSIPRRTIKRNDDAIYYFVDDHSGAHVPASRLNKILEKLKQGHSITSGALLYLQQQKLIALHEFATGSSTFEHFCKAAQAEKSKRMLDREVERQAQEIEHQAQEIARQARIKLAQKEAHAARLALEKDPRHIVKIKNQKLRARYGLTEYIEEDSFNRLMDVLRRLDAGKRLSEQDVLWLSTHGSYYHTDEIRSAFHLIEAEYFVNEYKQSGDLWMAVNASSHYRKCDNAAHAEALLNAAAIDNLKSTKLKSALYTTLGGVKRDLNKWDTALELGEKAHALMNKDFRPCTLLGAVHIELGHYMLGQEWYTKAVERGASERAIDSDLRSIFMRSDKQKQAEMSAYLLNFDAKRYSWAIVNKKSKLT